ncbi:MAG TPA: hypothetical protein VFY74_05605 [Methyloceanibacter sp.]|nr:hypothetical protein [Methyloceanibacter sp.]
MVDLEAVHGPHHLDFTGAGVGLHRRILYGDQAPPDRLHRLDHACHGRAVSIFSAYGGNQYGPCYYFEAWPFAVLTVLKVIDPILFGVQRPAAAPWIASGLVASLMFECAYLPARLEREHRVVVERQDVYRQAEKEGLDNAIVIVASKVGTIRPMPPGDLIRNGLHIGEQKVLYARNRGARNQELLAHFPGREVYFYSNGRLQAATDR